MHNFFHFESILSLLVFMFQCLIFHAYLALFTSLKYLSPLGLVAEM